MLLMEFSSKGEEFYNPIHFEGYEKIQRKDLDELLLSQLIFSI